MKKFFKTLLINILLLLALLTLIDPFFNRADMNHTTKVNRGLVIREFPPHSDFYKKPPDHYITETQQLEQKKYRVRTDANGFIIGEHTQQDKAKADVIFFGGSTTECLYVDENKRFPYVVGEQLSNKTSGEKLQVLNSGLSHSHSLHSIHNLLAKGRPLEPKIVVWMHNINDLTLLTKTGDYGTAPETRTLMQTFDNEPAHTLSVLKRIEHFFTAIRELLFPNIYFRLATLHYEIRTPDSVDEWSALRDKNTFDYDTIEQKFEQSLSAFIQLSRAYDMEVVLMTQFNRLDPADNFIREIYSRYHQKDLDYDTFCEYYKKFNNKIREVAQREGLLLIDLAAEMESTNTYLCDAVHLNNKGSERVADIISNQLEEHYPDFIRLTK